MMENRADRLIRRWEPWAVTLLMLAVAVAATWPLALHFRTAIPCRTTAGRLFLNQPGDQVQLLYWFWLLRDNLFGTGGPVFMRNPYEFNMSAAQPQDGPYMYPLYFLHLLFSPLGDITAYNILVILSYVLTGLFTYLLVRQYRVTRMGALLGALIYTLVPSRVINLMGGHLNGLIYYLLPATLYFFDRALEKRSGWSALLCGLCVFWLATLEVHLIYYLCLALAVYLPFRMIFFAPGNREPGPAAGPEREGGWGAVSVLAGTAAALTVFYQGVSALHYSHPVLNSDFWVVLLLYPFLFFAFFLLLSQLAARILGLTSLRALRLTAALVAPLSLLALFSLFVALRSKAGVLLLAGLLPVVTAWCWRRAWRKLGRGARFRSGLLRRCLHGSLLLRLAPAFLGIVLGAGWVLMAKRLFFSASVAHGGRTLQDVKLYSPRLADLLSQGSEVYLGLVPLFLILVSLGLLTASLAGGHRRGQGEDPLLSAFYLFFFFLSFILGSGLAFGPSSLYGFFFDYFPFFNYPRVPARIMAFAFLAGAVLSAMAFGALQERLRANGQAGLGPVFLALLAAMVWYDFGAWRPVGLSIMDRGMSVYDYVRKHIGDGLLLELPLWPGDSHQSSLFEHYISLDRVRRVNGYTPIVTRRFVDQVYKPLATINQGLLDRDQYRLLRKMGVRFITVHDNPDVFPRKVSPFPPHTTVRRLMTSVYLDPVRLENRMFLPGLERPYRKVYLFRVRERPRPGTPGVAGGSCRFYIPKVYPARSLPHVTGRVEEDATIDRSVLMARRDRDTPHFLSYGPYAELPAGTYRVYFRMRGDGGEPEAEAARIDVAAYLSHEKQQVLVEKSIGQGELAGDRYRDFSLEFTLTHFARVEFRTWFTGTADLWLEKIVLTCGGAQEGDSGYRAEDLLGDTGFPVPDPAASSGRALKGDILGDRAGRMMYGPFRRFAAGRYRVRFFLRSDSDFLVDPARRQVARISVSTDEDRTVLVRRDVTLEEIRADHYRPLDLTFLLPRDNELSFNLWFTGQANVLADRISVQYLGPVRQPALPFLFLLQKNHAQRTGQTGQ